jgi:hypothetical protein
VFALPTWAGGAFLMGRSYYFRRVRYMVGMTVVGDATVPVELAEYICPAVSIQYA